MQKNQPQSGNPPLIKVTQSSINPNLNNQNVNVTYSNIQHNINNSQMNSNNNRMINSLNLNPSLNQNNQKTLPQQNLQPNLNQNLITSTNKNNLQQKIPISNISNRNQQNIPISNSNLYPQLNSNVDNENQNANRPQRQVSRLNNNVQNNNYNLHQHPVNIQGIVPRFNRIGKIDGIYKESFLSVRNSIVVQIILISILMLGHLFLWLNYKRDEQFKRIQTNSLKNIMVHLVIMFLIPISLYRIYLLKTNFNSVQFAVRLANNINHGVQSEPLTIFDTLQNCTSTRFYISASEVTYEGMQGLSQQMKNIHMNQTKNQILTALRFNSTCLNCISALCQFGLIGIAIFGIIMLCLADTQAVQKVIFISFIVFGFYKNIGFIIVVLLLVLSPLICIGVCVFFCCAGPQNTGAFIPQSKKPTTEMIVNSGGSCTICFMDFSTSDDVVVLPCSEKHMFHQLCIKGWLNVRSTTCPICRHDLRSNV